MIVEISDPIETAGAGVTSCQRWCFAAHSKYKAFFVEKSRIVTALPANVLRYDCSIVATMERPTLQELIEARQRWGAREGLKFSYG